MLSFTNSPSETKESLITDIHHIKDFLSFYSKNSFVILDLDNTVMEPDKELGSDQWFCHLMKLATKAKPDKDTIALVIALYNAVQHQTRMKVVEEEVIQIIQKLQSQQIPVLALTARGQEIIKTTLNQLTHIGIHFKHPLWDNLNFQIDINDEGRSLPYFTNGILFCNGRDKGACLDYLFSTIKYKPAHLIMVDDKPENILTVKKSIDKHQCPFIGLRYGYLDNKVKQINFEKAHEQMDSISHLFPNEAKNIKNILNQSTKVNSELASCSLFKNSNDTQSPSESNESAQLKL